MKKQNQRRLIIDQYNKYCNIIKKKTETRRKHLETKRIRTQTGDVYIRREFLLK